VRANICPVSTYQLGEEATEYSFARLALENKELFCQHSIGQISIQKQSTQHVCLPPMPLKELVTVIRVPLSL